MNLSFEEVNAVLREIEEAIKLSNSITEELGEVMTTLGTCWEGEAYNSYLAVYTRYKETVLAQFNLLMQAYRRTYEEAINLGMLIPPMPPTHWFL